MRVINTIDSPKISLKRRPPHNASKNILSDLRTVNFINRNPKVKFRMESNAPNKIDLKIRPETSEVR
jgi:hypothetical protein